MGEASAGFRQEGVKIGEAFVVDVAGVSCDVELGSEFSGRTFAIEWNRTNSWFDSRSNPSAMLDEMETAARRIWSTNPKSFANEGVRVSA